MRFSRSLCGAGFLAGAAAFLAAGLLADLLEDFRAVFWPAFLGAAFLAGAFALAFLAGFLAAFRAKFLCGQGVRFTMASAAAPRASCLSAVELSQLRCPSSTISDGAGPRCRATPISLASGA